MVFMDKYALGGKKLKKFEKNFNFFKKNFKGVTFKNTYCMNNTMNVLLPPQGA